MLERYRRHVFHYRRKTDGLPLSFQCSSARVTTATSNAPLPEPHDVRAHLLGGVPKAELTAKAELVSAHGLDPRRCSPSATPTTSTSAPNWLRGKGAIKPVVEANAGLVIREQALRDAFNGWWQAHSPRITALAGQPSFVGLRNDPATQLRRGAGAGG